MRCEQDRRCSAGRAHWLRAQDGGAAVEFALVALLLVTFIFGAIDLGRLAWEWNRAAEATQAGARTAVVNDMVAANWQTYNALEEITGIKAGDTVETGDVSPNPVVCDSTGCDGDASPGFFNEAAFDRIVTRMQAVNPSIQPENVEIAYTHVGLGFAGNPFGSDISPLVTVSLKDMVFQFITPGLSGLAEINMPPFLTTLSGEDYTTG